MRRPVCVLVFGLTLLPGYARQQNNSQAETAAPAVPSTSPAPSTPYPSHDAPLSSGASALPGPANPSEIVSVDAALQTQIQDALNKDPIFGHDHLKVTVRADGIELSGDVANGRDRQNAARIAQSYARGKKVVNHIVVRRQGENPGANSPKNPPADINAPAGTPASSKNNLP